MKAFKVVIPQPIAKEGIELLERNGCDVIVLENMEKKTLLEHTKDCDALLIRTAEIDRDVIENANNLKVIARHGVGLDNVDIEAASEKNIYVCNAPNANINSVAEHVVGLMAAVSHQIVRADKALRKGQFQVRNTYIGTELRGKTVGLIGIGNIGKLVAEKCGLGFGMDIIAYDPYVKNLDKDYIKLVDKLDDIFEQADYVSIHVPYLPQLHHFIGEEQLNKMKSTAFLINAARGGLVDEDALYHALKEGKIAGAGLDCFEQEPTPEIHPFWELDNVVVTPHMAAHTKEAMIRMAVDPAEEILRVKNNEAPTHCVNKKALTKTV